MTQVNLSMEHVPVDTLQPNPWNTNRITDPANEEKLRVSLQRFGAFKPVIVRTLPGGKLEILGGEHRWKAAKQLGWDTVPIVNLGKISDTKAKEIGLVDNGRYGEDDTLQLGALLRDLGDDVLSFVPFSDTELASILKSTEIDLDDLDNPADPPLADLNQLKPAPSTQVMRFKVPVEDVAWISTMIEQAMKNGGFKDEDALSNAGNALVSLLSRLKV